MPSGCDISIIIVSYNCLEWLKRCLGSIETQAGINFEIIVVDNNSRDGTRKYLQDNENIYAIFPGHNLGFGVAVNLASKKAQGQYLFILNPDTILQPNCLSSLFEFANGHPDFGLISPMLVNPDGTPQISARKFPGRRDIFFGRGSPLFKLGLTREKDAGYCMQIGEGPLEVPAVSATAILVRSDLFRELYGFDSRFFMYMEDLDLCKRISQRSLPIWVLPEVKVVHAWRKSSKTRPYFTSFYHHLSVYKYFKKHYSSQWYYNIGLALALVAGFALSSVTIALRERG